MEYRKLKDCFAALAMTRLLRCARNDKRLLRCARNDTVQSLRGVEDDEAISSATNQCCARNDKI